MAPTVQAPTFEADQIVISGSSSESEATDLAAAITGGGSFEIEGRTTSYVPG